MAERKTMIIGIGGTGLTAIREVRRLIAEQYEAGLRAPEIGAVRFLYIDTDAGDEDRLRWTVLNKSIRLSDAERAIVTGDQLRPMVEHPEDYPDVGPWLPRIRDYIGDPGPGAKGIRPYGRLIYEFSGNKEKIHGQMVAMYDELNNDFKQATDWRIYLVCGLSGGTGSGMFLPFSYDLIRWRLHTKGTAAQKFHAFLVLPPLQVTGRHDRYHANAYAALRELNYHSFQGAPDGRDQIRGLPYDNCYLVEPCNAEGHTIGLDNLPLLIAQRIFLNIQRGNAASAADAYMDNPNLGQVYEDEADSTRRQSMNFSTFGLSALSYPREVVSQCLGLELSVRLLEEWLADRAHPQNINQCVREELEGLRLSRTYVYGDGDLFGGVNRGNYESEIRQMADDRIRAAKKRTLGAEAGKIRSDIEDGFRDHGIHGFFQNRTKDVRGAAEVLDKLLRSRVTAFLGSPREGIGFARLFLTELQNVLKEYRNEAGGMTSENNQKKVPVLLRNFTETANQVALREKGKLIYTDGRAQRDAVEVGDVLKSYLVGLAKVEAGRCCLNLLDAFSPRVADLLASLDVWEGRMREVRDLLAGRREKLYTDLEKGSRENGRAIVSKPGVEALVPRQPGEWELACAEVGEILRARLGQEKLDLVLLSGRTDPGNDLFESFSQWVLRENCPIEFRRVSLYDKLLEEFPEANRRRNVLAEARGLSQPFLRFLPEEVGKVKVNQSTVQAVTVPEAPGRATREGVPSQTLVREDLLAAGVNGSNVLPSGDPERIVFLQETQVFPLRFIATLKDLRASYDRYAVPEVLHVDRNVVPGLYDLYLMTAEERKSIREAEDAFCLGRVLGWIQQKVNQSTRRQEVRYEYEKPGTLGDTVCVAGAGWDEAFRAFVDDATSPAATSAVREGRLHLQERAREFLKETAEDAGKKEALTGSFRAYLAERKEDYKAGTDDPRYQRDQRIANRIIQ